MLVLQYSAERGALFFPNICLGAKDRSIADESIDERENASFLSARGSVAGYFRTTQELLATITCSLRLRIIP